MTCSRCWREDTRGLVQGYCRVCYSELGLVMLALAEDKPIRIHKNKDDDDDAPY